jgi:hypothetical protein
MGVKTSVAPVSARKDLKDFIVSIFFLNAEFILTTSFTFLESMKGGFAHPPKKYISELKNRNDHEFRPLTI